MTISTIERAYQLARSGQWVDLRSLKQRLKAEGFRAVDVLLAPRTISSHLVAICEATSRPIAAIPTSSHESASSA